MRISNGSLEIQFFYRNDNISIDRSSTRRKGGDVLGEKRGGKKKENSTVPRGRIIPPYGDKGLVRGVSYVSINLLGCSTSTTIMLRVPDNYYKKWRRTPGASSPCCKLVSSSSIRIEISNLSDKRM